MSRPWWKTPNPYWLMPYGCLMVVCIGLTAPSKPQLIIDIACAIHPPVAVGEIDSELCRRDVGVQKVAAKLTMGFTLTSGILSVLSTGWWGSLSDRFGRCKVMAFGQLGILLSDAAFLFVVSHSELITTFGHWILYVGPVLFGIFGGLNTFNVGSGAYLADLAGDGSIAGYLSMVIGFVRIGMIVGPILGTLLMEASGDVLLPLKVAVAVHIVICAVAFTIIPESLSREARERAAKDTATVSTEPTSWSTWLLAPLAPLAIFLPTQSQIQRGRSAFAQGHFNMFILAVVSFIISMTRGVDVLKAQYATLVLGWTQKQFGPFMSFVESCKVAILMIVIPLLSKFVQPYFTAPAPPSTQEPGEETPLLQPTATEPDSTSKSPTTNTHKSTRYDYFLWLLCLAIEVVGYTLLGSNAASNAALYVFASGLHAFAAPLDSVFLGLTLALKPSDVPSGKLFGALGVIDALALSFLSAPLWTAVFTATVDTYPPAMFLVAAGMLTLVGLLGFCVKIKGSV